MLVLLAAAALFAAAVAAVLPSPHHRWALGVAALAVLALLWPVECSSAGDGASVTGCSSAAGVRLPGGVGAVGAVAGVAVVCVVVVLVRRRRPPG